MKRVSWGQVEEGLSRYPGLAAREELVITPHGMAGGLLIVVEWEDDWFDYRLESDPRFLNRIAEARASLRAGRGLRLEDVDAGSNKGASASRSRRWVRADRARSRPSRGG